MIYVYILAYFFVVTCLVSIMLAYQEDKRYKRRKHFLERREEYYRTGR